MQDLARFANHPEASTDYRVEVDDLAGYAYETAAGLNFVPGNRSRWPFRGRLARVLRFASSPEFAAPRADARQAAAAARGLERRALAA